jgi:hypothetical protein
MVIYFPDIQVIPEKIMLVVPVVKVKVVVFEAVTMSDLS